jgi:hypothetical protein
MDESGYIFMLLLVSGVSLFIGIAIGDTNNYIQRDVNAAIERCEAELPRHLGCEAVITARVKEKE